MEDQKQPQDMTDQELVQEWNCVEDCDFAAPRTEALAREMASRNIDF